MEVQREEEEENLKLHFKSDELCLEGKRRIILRYGNILLVQVENTSEFSPVTYDD